MNKRNWTYLSADVPGNLLTDPNLDYYHLTADTLQKRSSCSYRCSSDKNGCVQLLKIPCTQFFFCLHPQKCQSLTRATCFYKFVTRKVFHIPPLLRAGSVCRQFKSQSKAKKPETSGAEQTCQYREEQFTFTTTTNYVSATAKLQANKLTKRIKKDVNNNYHSDTSASHRFWWTTDSSFKSGFD